MIKPTRHQQISWDKLKGTYTGQRTMPEVVTHLQEFVSTYHNQSSFELYRDETVIDDILYGLGSALDEKYRFADGHLKFKRHLLEVLTNDIANHDSIYTKGKKNERA